MSSNTATHQQPSASCGSGGKKPNRDDDGNRRPLHGGKGPSRITDVRCKLCQRRGHKDRDCPSRTGLENAQNPSAQGNRSSQHRRRKEGMNARDRRRVRRQQERQQQQQRQLAEMREEIEELRDVARQLYLELLDVRLQQSRRPVEEGGDGEDEDGEQYP
ncbi:hypothetical protein IFM51744_04685 [Aspergillus udagawae]|nr:hypothetical protein IFM51744_04685 [Aspergillus udagawae]